MCMECLKPIGKQSNTGVCALASCNAWFRLAPSGVDTCDWLYTSGIGISETFLQKAPVKTWSFAVPAFIKMCWCSKHHVEEGGQQ